jgi:ABC-type transport system involved in cytochrome bd biosynthesis fused ATPase/permease subunit
LNGPVGIVLGVIVGVVGLSLIATGGWMLTQGGRFPDWLTFVLALVGLSLLVDIPIGVLVVRAANRRAT